MGGGGGPSFGGVAGVWRMFNAQVGGQIAWLLPLAAVSLVVGLWRTRGLRRAGFVLFGVWALVHVAVFSYQQGIFHPYYVSALAPAVAALAGMGLVALWRLARESWVGAGVLAATMAGTAWLAVDLLGAHRRVRPVAARRDPGRGGRRRARHDRPAPGAPRAARGGGGRDRCVRAVRRPRVLRRRQPRSRPRRQQRAGRAGERLAGRLRRTAAASSAAARRRAAPVAGGGLGRRAAPPAAGGPRRRAARARAGGPPSAAGRRLRRARVRVLRHARLPRRATRAAPSTCWPRPARRPPRRSSSRPARRSSRSAASAAATTRRPSPSWRRWSPRASSSTCSPPATARSTRGSRSTAQRSTATTASPALPRHNCGVAGAREAAPMNKIKVLTISTALTATLLLPAMAEAKASWT